MEPTSPLTVLETSPLSSAIPSSPPLHPLLQSRKRRRVSSSAESYSSSPSGFSADTSNTSSSTDSTSDSTPTKRKGPVAGKKRVRQTEPEKIENILATLTALRWDVKRFLRALYKHRSQHRFRVAQKHFCDVAYKELPKERGFARIVQKKRRGPILDWGYKWALEDLHNELRTLGSQKAFWEFNPPSKDEDIGTIRFIRDTNAMITTFAPHWVDLLQRACSDDTSSLNASALQPATLILATLCHLMRPKKCTNFQTTLGLYLYQGGARRRVLDTLCRFGLIVSYSTLQRRLTLLRAEAERTVEVVGRAPSAILTYDNFEFTEGRRGERTGDNREFRSISTALILEGRRFTNGKLLQTMWNPSSTLLSAEQVAQGLLPQKIDTEVSSSDNILYRIVAYYFYW